MALRILVAQNRVDVPGFGVLPAAGVYATVERPGQIRPGAEVAVATGPTSHPFASPRTPQAGCEEAERVRSQRGNGEDLPVAKYIVNERGVEHARELIDASASSCPAGGATSSPTPKPRTRS